MNVYTDNHNKVIVGDVDIKKLDCMAPADIADDHGPIPPPAKPAILITGEMLGNTPSAFQEGQKVLAENWHAEMDLQYKKSIKPIKTPAKPVKYPLPPESLGLTEDQKKYYMDHGYIILKKHLRGSGQLLWSEYKNTGTEAKRREDRYNDCWSAFWNKTLSWKDVLRTESRINKLLNTPREMLSESLIERQLYFKNFTQLKDFVFWTEAPAIVRWMEDPLNDSLEDYCSLKIG